MNRKSKRKTRPFEIAFVPDTQSSAEHNEDRHLIALGNYLADKKPDVVVHIGDHYDVPSLSSYDKPGSRHFEGRRYADDIGAAVATMSAFVKALHKSKAYRPRLVYCLGNHEQRIERARDADPVVAGSTMSYDDLRLKEMGWEVQDYLQPILLGGVAFAHYFYNPKTGRPYTGTAANVMRAVGFSFAQGHRQGFDYAVRELSNGTRQQALIAGSFYPHKEAYRGPQATNEYRGIAYMHEVHDGQYDLMQVSLDYLMREWL
jgi:hypothetical protein